MLRQYVLNIILGLNLHALGHKNQLCAALERYSEENYYRRRVMCPLDLQHMPGNTLATCGVNPVILAVQRLLHSEQLFVCEKDVTHLIVIVPAQECSTSFPSLLLLIIAEELNLIFLGDSQSPPLARLLM